MSFTNNLMECKELFLAALVFLNSFAVFAKPPKEKDLAYFFLNLGTKYEISLENSQEPNYSYLENPGDIEPLELTIEETARSKESFSIISQEEKEEVSDLIKETTKKNELSYYDLINQFSNLSENQRLIFLNSLGRFLRYFNYDLNLKNNEITPREEFLAAIKEKTGIGVCKQNVSNLERIARDSGMTASSVSGISNWTNHVYLVLKTEKGSAIVDTNGVLRTDTKNIEKLLKLYEEQIRTINFSHSFFKDSNFMYRLITKSGENYLKFIDYDLTTEELKNSLINLKEKNILSGKLISTENLSYSDLNFNGINIKIGEFKEESSILKKDLILLVTGYEKTHNFSGLDAELKANLIYAKLYQSLKNKEENNFPDLTEDFYGFNYGLLISSANATGLNVSAKIAGTSLFQIPLEENIFFTDINSGFGTSYGFQKDSFNLTPYVVGQFTIFPKNISTDKFIPRLSELRGGMKLETELNKLEMSIDTNYLWRIWEHGPSIEFGLKNNFFDMNIKSYFTKSTYEFNPDCYGINAKIDFTLKNFMAGFEYARNIKNYEQEKDMENSIIISGSLKF